MTAYWKNFHFLQQLLGMSCYHRGGDDQGLHKLPAPYSPARIKEIAGQAQVYIRPLQKNLMELEEHCVQYQTDQHLEVSKHAIQLLQLKQF